MQGILFKPDMIKATAEDIKTVTRRLVKFHTDDGHRTYQHVYPHPNGGFTFTDAPLNRQQLSVIQGATKTGLMPRYKVGEIVYIKELWAVWSALDNKKPSEINCKENVWYPLGSDLIHVPLWVGKLRTPLMSKFNKI